MGSIILYWTHYTSLVPTLNGSTIAMLSLRLESAATAKMIHRQVKFIGAFKEARFALRERRCELRVKMEQ
jgi:hypothetical protein